MEKILTLEEFTARRRDSLLDYSIYEKRFKDKLETFALVAQGLAQPPEVLQDFNTSDFMVATEQRAWDGVDHLTFGYCAGHSLDELRAFYPTAIGYWESYAHYHKVWHDTEADERQKRIPHFALPADDYWDVNRMLCFGILLGWAQLIPRLVEVVDYNNIQKDGLYERLLICLGIPRDTPPNECTRHLPYFKTLKIFAAEPPQRPALMAEYLEDWYHASRREPYYNQHENGGYNYRGYWSWESAAITYLLDIDDRSYRDAQFYPADLVAFAKAQSPASSATPSNTELRAKAGEPCPKTGQWQAMDIPPQTRHIQQGLPMPNLNSAYGLTVWVYLR